MASTIRSTTQQQIDIEDVVDNIVIQKDGACSLILKTNAINFGLLSEEEQDATIYAYAAFLNSLTFSVQILIRSDVKDISNYLQLLEEQEFKQSNPIKKRQIKQYKVFISSLITERNVLEKSFYIVIPFSTLELGVAQSVSSSFFKSSSKLPFEKSYIVEKALATLEPKRDHVIRQLARIGLGARQLRTQELIQLLFSMYNASSTQGQKISNTADYTVPLVQPAYIRPQEEVEPSQGFEMPAPSNEQWTPVQTEAPAVQEQAQQQAPEPMMETSSLETPQTQMIEQTPTMEMTQQPSMVTEAPTFPPITPPPSPEISVQDYEFSPQQQEEVSLQEQNTFEIPPIATQDYAQASIEVPQELPTIEAPVFDQANTLTQVPFSAPTPPQPIENTQEAEVADLQNLINSAASDLSQAANS